MPSAAVSPNSPPISSIEKPVSVRSKSSALSAPVSVFNRSWSQPEKAKTVGITMAEVKAMTGWSKTGGFFGAVKRHGLTLTKDANGAYHAA